MKLPNSYGSVIKMSGKRRKPYAVRISSIAKFINIYAPHNAYERDALIKHGFKWRRLLWSGMSTDKSQALADKLPYDFDYEYRQKFTYLAYFSKRDEALTYLAKYNSGFVVEEQTRFTEEPTFAEMYEKWKAHKQGLKKQLAKSTWHNYDNAFSHFEAIHQRKFNSLKAEELQPLLNNQNEKSSGIVGFMRGLLKGMYKFAVNNGYCEINISERLVYEWSEPEENIHIPFSESEIDFLWQNLDKPDIDLILIYIYTGLRPSELLDIHTSNINLDGQYMIGGMKSDYGKERIIPISDKILPLVKKRYDAESEYLISSKRGRKLSYTVFSRDYFHPLMKELGWKHKPHDMRHTFATLMDNANTNVICKKMILGHSLKDDLTASVYTHKTPKDLLKEVNKI